MIRSAGADLSTSAHAARMDNPHGVTAAQAGATGALASMAALRALSTTGFTSGHAVAVACYATIGDQGGGLFVWNATSTATHNAGTVIRPSALTAGQAGRWVRLLFGQPVSVTHFGAHMTGESVTLAARYATLADAQVDYPHAAALTDELDWAAAQAAINWASAQPPFMQGTTFNFSSLPRGAEIRIPAGRLRINRELRAKMNGITVRGAGIYATEVAQFAAGENGFNFATDNPVVDQLGGSWLHDMTVFCRVSDPTAGVGVVFNRTTISGLENVQAVNWFGCIETIGCGEGVRLSRVDTIQGSNQSSLKTGSFAVRVRRGRATVGTGNGEVDPVDGLFYQHTNALYVSDCNFRATGNGAQYGFDVWSVDGIFATNSHWLGHTRALVRYYPEQSNLAIVSCDFTNCYFDPRDGVNDYAVLYETNAALSSCTVSQHTYTGGRMVGGTRNGVLIDIADAREIDIDDVQMTDNGTSLATDAQVWVRRGQDVKIQSRFVRGNGFSGAPHILIGDTGLTLGGTHTVMNCQGTRGGPLLQTLGTCTIHIGNLTSRDHSNSGYQFSNTTTILKSGNLYGPAVPSQTVGSNVSMSIFPEFDWTAVSGGPVAGIFIGGWAWVGREVEIICASALTFRHNYLGTGNLRCPGSVDLVCTSGTRVVVKATATTWNVRAVFVP